MIGILVITCFSKIFAESTECLSDCWRWNGQECVLRENLRIQILILTEIINYKDISKIEKHPK